MRLTAAKSTTIGWSIRGWQVPAGREEVPPAAGVASIRCRALRIRPARRPALAAGQRHGTPGQAGAGAVQPEAFPLSLLDRRQYRSWAASSSAVRRSTRSGLRVAVASSTALGRRREIHDQAFLATGHRHIDVGKDLRIEQRRRAACGGRYSRCSAAQRIEVVLLAGCSRAPSSACRGHWRRPTTRWPARACPVRSRGSRYRRRRCG